MASVLSQSTLHKILAVANVCLIRRFGISRIFLIHNPSISRTCIEIDRKRAEYEGGVQWRAVVDWAMDVRFELLPTLTASS